MRSFTAGQLAVVVESNRSALGAAAARRAAEAILKVQSGGRTVRVVFAAAPSQNEMLAALVATPGIDWSRVEAFHMDEYLGLPADAPQLFRRYLCEHLFDRVQMGDIRLIDGQAADPVRECERYGALLREKPIDLVCLGIGENGHLAFNDPPVADFQDPVSVKVVELDDACRRQQVHDGAFGSVGEVPRTALTLTIPALMDAVCLSAAVPGPAKAKAVKDALEGPIGTRCPASILRTHRNAALFLDPDSASLLAG